MALNVGFGHHKPPEAPPSVQASLRRPPLPTAHLANGGINAPTASETTTTTYYLRSDDPAVADMSGSDLPAIARAPPHALSIQSMGAHLPHVRHRLDCLLPLLEIGVEVGEIVQSSRDAKNAFEVGNVGQGVNNVYNVFIKIMKVSGLSIKMLVDYRVVPTSVAAAHFRPAILEDGTGPIRPVHAHLAPLHAVIPPDLSAQSELADIATFDTDVSVAADISVPSMPDLHIWANPSPETNPTK